MNNIIRRNLRRAPLPLTLIITLLIVVSFFGALFGASLIIAVVARNQGWAEYKLEFFNEFIVAIYAILMIVIFGYKKILVMKGTGFFKGTITAGFLFVICCLTSFQMLIQSKLDGISHIEKPINIIYFVMTMLMIGIAEEGIYRGVVLNILYDRFSKTQTGIICAIVLDGVFFGAMHLMNYASVGNWTPVIVQSITAGVMGMYFAIVYVQTGNFWISVILHAWNDFAALLQSGIFGQSTVVESIGKMSYMNLFAVIVYLIPCLVLLRKGNRQKMVMRANGVSVVENAESISTECLVAMIVSIISFVLSFMGVTVGFGIISLMMSLHANKLARKENIKALIGIGFSIASIVFSLIILCGYLLI